MWQSSNIWSGSNKSNFINEEIKTRLNSEIACYNSFQNHLSSSLLSKNIEIETYRTVILPAVLYE